MNFLLSTAVVVCLRTKVEQLKQCCKRVFKRQDIHPEKQTGNIAVFRLEDVCQPHTAQMTQRRDFYSIGLIRGSDHYHHADNMVLAGTTLVFFNPHTSYTWGSLPVDRKGFCCMFSMPFFTVQMEEKIKALPMFKTGGQPVQYLTGAQEKIVTDIFVHMLEEISSDYMYKYDLLRNYISQLLHLAMKVQLNSGAEPKGSNGSNNVIHTK